VYEIIEFQRFLANTLPLIEQPGAAAQGGVGTGTTIAVLDTGVDYTLAPFNCTAPGVPAGCRVVATLEAAPNDFQLDDNGHGTNVSAIAASTASAADLVVADVFNGTGASTLDIMTAVNWVIANQNAFNIVSMNLSLGNPFVRSTTPCPSDSLAASMAAALAAGVQPVISSGNAGFASGAYVDGIASPACVPAAVSVGAVYDTNVGGLIWQSGTTFECTDFTSTTDQVTCFSQSGPNLDLLAPGALVTAGGSTQGGTSQAAPHVAGAWAVVSALAPAGAASEDILRALELGGDPIADTRPPGGRTSSRINMVPEPGASALFATGVLGLLGLRRLRLS